MKRLIELILGLTLSSSFVLAQEPAARLQGTVLDTAGMPIPKVQITVQNSAASFKATSDDDGKFQIELPPGEWEVRSDKLSGFGATNRNLTVAINQAVEVTIVPAVSTEGVLCILQVTSGPTRKPKKRTRHR